MVVNKDTLEGNWNMLKGKVKEKWGQLTDNDLTEIQGKKDQLIGKLQKKYGYAKDRAEKEYAAWEASCNCDRTCKTKETDKMREKELSTHKR